MISVACIVEGDGEVSALPILLRRINDWRSPDLYVHPLPPIRVRRDRFLNKEEDFRKHLLLAASKCGENGWILVLLDADDDCPKELGAEILRRARDHVPHRKISVVLANREFEAWFIAAAKSLNGFRGFSIEATETVNAELPRNAKKWMSLHMQENYQETIDQPAFSARFDLQDAFEGSRSFRKLCLEWSKQIIGTS